MRQPVIDLEAEKVRLIRSLHDPADRCFLKTGPRAYSIGDLSRASHLVASLLQSEQGHRHEREPFPGVGVFVHSPFHLAACMVGAWRARFRPVLLDPSSRGDVEFLVSENPEMRCLADANDLPAGCRLELPDLDADDRVAGPSPAPRIDSFEPCTAFFTSGSEGRAKLVPKSWRQVCTHIAAASKMLRLPDGCRTLCFVPLVHILGFSYGFMATLRAGGQTFVCGDPLPSLMRQALLSFKPDAVVATAFHYRVLNAVLASDDKLPDAVFICSGAPLLSQDRVEFEGKTGRRITELYGSTETGGIAWRRDGAPWAAYPGARIKIAGGRVHVQSPWAHPENPEHFVATHDVAEAEPSGFRLLGRTGNIVKIGGRRFSGLEVEEAIRGHASVQDAGVVTVDRNGEPALCALIVLKKESTDAAKRLRSYLAQHLARYKVPRTIRVVTALPRTKLGKLNYAAMQRMAVPSDCRDSD